MGSITKVALTSGLFLTTGFLLQPYRPVIVRGQSMEPTYENGQLLVAEVTDRKPHVGDVVIVDKDGSTLIKRVTMVAGDHYEEAYVPYAHQWVPVVGSAVRKMIKKGRVPCRMRTIPKGLMFITGDNPDVSLDSRMFGLVPESSIRGFVEKVG